MEEKQVTQVQQGTPPGEVAKPEPIAVPQPIEQLKQEIERKEAEIKRLQGITKDLQKGRISKEEVDALHQKIDDMQEWVAGAMDDLVSKVSGEEEKPARTSYRQQVSERKAKAKPQPRDPDAEAFVGYMQSQGMTLNSPLIKEAIAEERGPQEALEYLKGKIEAKQAADMEKKAEQIATQKFEQMLKDKGLTASGVSGPTAAGGKIFTTEQIRNMSVEEFKANQPAIREAQRLGKIK